jgi:hypothetical protein
MRLKRGWCSPLSIFLRLFVVPKSTLIEGARPEGDIVETPQGCRQTTAWALARLLEWTSETFPENTGLAIMPRARFERSSDSRSIHLCCQRHLHEVGHWKTMNYPIGKVNI